MKIQKKYIYLIISTVAMCLYGYGFVLTVFNKSLEETFNCTSKETSLLFSVCLVMFGLGILISGYIYHRLNLRTMFAISTVMIGIGILLTAKANSIEFCYLTIGALYGFGAGIGYKAQITSMLAWFPANTGGVGGILFMGTGLTAMIFNVPLNLWIEKYGWRNAFAILGWITVLLLVINTLVVKPYPMDPFNRMNKKEGNKERDIPGMSTGQMIHTVRFWLFFIWCILMSSVSMTVASNSVASAVTIGVTSTTAAILSGLISLFNSLSRIIYGVLYDKQGWKKTMTTATLFMACSVGIILCALWSGNKTMLIIGYVFLGLCFGSVHPISSAFTLQSFGAKYYSENYSVQGLFSTISTFTGPLFLGYLYAMIGSYYKTYLVLVVFVVLAVLSFLGLTLVYKRNAEY